MGPEPVSEENVRQFPTQRSLSENGGNGGRHDHEKRLRDVEGGLRELRTELRTELKHLATKAWVLGGVIGGMGVAAGVAVGVARLVM